MFSILLWFNNVALVFHILQILRKCEGSVELVDVSNEVPQLIRRPGLRKWKVSHDSSESRLLDVSIENNTCSWSDTLN